MALNELIRANLPLFRKEIETISASQLNLLKAAANGESHELWFKRCFL